MNNTVLISILVIFIATIISNIYLPSREEVVFRTLRKILIYFSTFLGLIFATYLVYLIFPGTAFFKLNREIGIIDVVLGAISGFFLAYLFESTKKPNIEFKLNDIPQYGPRWVFRNLTILNKEQRFPYRSANINQASAWITYQKIDNSVCEKKIRARWATTNQPIVLGQIDYANIYVPSRESIPKREASEIPLVFKIKDDHNIYAFNNESYMYLDFASTENTIKEKSEIGIIENPKEEFIKKFCVGKKGKYLAKIRVLADGHEFIKCYEIDNCGSGLDDIQIKEIECKNKN